MYHNFKLYVSENQLYVRYRTQDQQCEGVHDGGQDGASLPQDTSGKCEGVHNWGQHGASLPQDTSAKYIYIYVYHMFFDLWGEISLFHEIINYIAQGSTLKA